MTALSFTIVPQQPDHLADIEALNAEAFGPGRFARAAYRLREGATPAYGLSFVALLDGRLIGSVVQTHILIGGKPALLLGPLCVLPMYKGQGAGKALMRVAVEAARVAGHRAILLVGDEPYYWPFGFRQTNRRIVMPGPVDENRVLLAELVAGVAEDYAGEARPAVVELA